MELTRNGVKGKKKLGEILLERGLITRAQLDQALRAHLFFGGHLGTSLIESRQR